MWLGALTLRDKNHADGRPDLATMFVDRMVAFVGAYGTLSVVTPQNWAFLNRYKRLRRRLLKRVEWHARARLGARGFERGDGKLSERTQLEEKFC